MAKSLLFIILFYSQVSNAGELIVVTADRIATPYSQSGSSVQLISGDRIEQSNTNDVHEILGELAGVHVAHSGGPGGSSSLFLRGSESNHVLVLIDGIEMNDPSNPTRQFDFAQLSATDIESIEVLKGSQSVLYGSDAIGGVISITTKSGKKKSQLDAGISYGSFNSFSANGGIRESIQNGNYSLGMEFKNSEGFSSANQRDNPNAEDDGQNIFTLSGKLEKRFPGYFEFEASIRVVDDTTDLDNSGGPGKDDPNDQQDINQYYQKIQLKKHFLDGLLESILLFSFTKHKREFRRIPDAADATSSLQNNEGTLFKTSLQNNFLISKIHTSTLGVEYETEKDQSLVSGPTENSATTIGFFAHHKITTGSFFASFGGRVDGHDQFGSHLTYKLAPGYYLKEYGTKLRSSFSTGFKSPSLNQLYGQIGGNKELLPEESISFELGVDQKVFNFFEFNLTFFTTQLKERFSFDLFNFKTINAGEAKIKGMELGGSIPITEAFKLSGQYTFLDTEDVASKLPLARRPETSFSLRANFRASSHWSFVGSLNHVGERDDFDATTFARVKNPAYTLFGFSANFKPNETLRLWIKADNIFDVDYEEVDGLGTAGRSGRFGLNLVF